MTEPEPESQPPARARRRRGLRLALFAGILLWLSHPAISLWPLAWIAITPLITGVTRATRLRRAMWRGYLFGWVYLGCVWYWTGLTIVAWTHSDIGWLAWFGLTLILASFYGLWGGAAWWLAHKTAGWYRVGALSAAWVVMEWLRTLGRLTMPWAQLSYSQFRVLPLLQIAEVTGAYGVSFLIMIFNTTLSEWWRDRTDPAGLRRVGMAGIAIAAVCIYGAVRLGSSEPGVEITVAAMQPNFHVTSEANTTRDLGVFTALTKQAAAAGPVSLYVWPESAAPSDAVNDYRTHNPLRAIAEQYKAALATGSRVIEPRTKLEFNSSVLIAPDGATQRYDKQQLVPFGEFIPFRDNLPNMLDSNFQFPPNDVSPGTSLRTLDFTTSQGVPVSLGPFICYESMYPSYARSMTKNGANLLITQSNDDWFQSESALEQHLSAVVMRAIENRRSVVRATTTGITCILDSRGRVVGLAPENTPAVVVHKVVLTNSRTIYTRFGDWFVLLCGAYLVTIYGREFRQRKSVRRG